MLRHKTQLFLHPLFFFLTGKLHYRQWDFWHLTTCGRISVHHMGTNHVVFISECRFCFRIMRFIFRMRFVFQNIALAFLFQNVVCVSECRLFFGIAWPLCATHYKLLLTIKCQMKKYFKIQEPTQSPESDGVCERNH